MNKVRNPCSPLGQLVENGRGTACWAVSAVACDLALLMSVVGSKFV